MKNAYVWIRKGDNDDYHKFDTPYEAGQELGQFTQDREPRYRSRGVELGGFTTNNYVSLFWGDDDTRPVGEAGLNTSERMDFEQGLNEAECYL